MLRHCTSYLSAVADGLLWLRLFTTYLSGDVIVVYDEYTYLFAVDGLFSLRHCSIYLSTALRSINCIYTTGEICTISIQHCITVSLEYCMWIKVRYFDTSQWCRNGKHACIMNKFDQLKCFIWQQLNCNFILLIDTTAVAKYKYDKSLI